MGDTGGVDSSESASYHPSETDHANASVSLESSDAELIAAAREGTEAAYDLLYRRHRPAAVQVARRICSHDIVDDVVSDAFLRVFKQLRAGVGPSTWLRPYLMAAIRTAHADLIRRETRYVWRADLNDSDFAQWVMSDDDAGGARRLDSQVLADAVSSLPERWRLVVWWTVVEKRPLTDVARELSITTNAAGVLALRARDGLRDAYLTQYLTTSENRVCQRWRTKLPTYVRGKLSLTQAARLGVHLSKCEPCRGVVTTLQSVMSRQEP